jgi:putative ABC transport system substrate-binding protein
MRVLSFLAVALVLGHLAAPLASPAQEAGRIPRIGMLGPSASDPMVEAFKQGLHELGYVDGKTIRFEYGDVAADLVRAKVDVLVASSQRAIAARQATTSIPIVMPIITDPVRLGLVASLARPGGNATGFATQNDELAGKWLELAKEAVPKATRVAVLFHPAYDGGVQLKASEATARSLGLQLQVVNVERSEDFSTAFPEVRRGRPEALVVSSSPLFYANRTRIVDFASTHRLPTIYHQSEFVVVSGGLMSYGPDFRDLFRRAASYVDKILRGARPGDLPVQQPTKFELVINRTTARALGLAIPRSLLVRADRIVE